MGNNSWTWAELSSEQLALVREAEQTLGADYLVVLQEAGEAADGVDEPAVDDIQIASLTESQLECLQGLEQQLGAMILAYQSV